MKETGKFLQRRAVLAGAVVIPLAAISAVVLQDDAWIPEQCDGCREIADSGLSTGTHTCDQAMLGARAAGLWGGDFDRLPR